VDLVVPEDPSAIEQVVPAWTIRPQLFRITETTISEDSVSVKAEHIFYDLRGNITTYAADNPTCVDALAGILDGARGRPRVRGLHEHAGHAHHRPVDAREPGRGALEPGGG
jgi:hypothetical protein